MLNIEENWLGVKHTAGWQAWVTVVAVSANCWGWQENGKALCALWHGEIQLQLQVGLLLKQLSFVFFFLDLDITCPSHIKVFINQSAAASKDVSWDEPLVYNKKNDTKFSVEVSPQWAEPPVTLPMDSSMYVVKYVVKNEFGQTASCSFNITVYNDSGKFHSFLL